MKTREDVERIIGKVKGDIADAERIIAPGLPPYADLWARQKYYEAVDNLAAAIPFLRALEQVVEPPES